MNEEYALWSKADLLRRRSLCAVEHEVLLDHYLTFDPIKPDLELDASVLHSLEGLFVELPNFSEALTIIRESLFDSIVRDAGFSCPNILLLGDPGIGKTYFMRRVSEVIGLDCLKVCGGVLDDSLTLSGTDPKFSGGSPGVLSVSVLESDVYPQFLLFDEIDKISRGGNYPIAPVLLSILEDETRVDFRDNFFGTGFDLTGFSVVATANRISDISDELLSRFLVVRVPLPTRDQVRGIAINIMINLCQERPYLSEVLTEELLARFTVSSLRGLKAALIRASGSALDRLYREQGVEALSGLKAGAILLEASDYREGISKPRMGY